MAIESNISLNKQRNNLQVFFFSECLIFFASGLIFPTAGSTFISQTLGQLNGLGGSVHLLGIPIPQSASTFAGFCQTMKEREQMLAENVVTLVGVEN